GNVLLDSSVAAEMGLKLGDRILLQERRPVIIGTDDRRFLVFTIVGLLEHHRVAKQQLPVVVASLPEIQHLGRFDETRPEISKVDIILEDASSPALRRTETAL